MKKRQKLKPKADSLPLKAVEDRLQPQKAEAVTGQKPEDHPEAKPQRRKRKTKKARRSHGVGSVYQRGMKGIWWIRYSRHGKEFRESSGSTDKDDADALLKKRQGEIAEGRWVRPELNRTSIDDLYKDVVLDYERNQQPSLSDVETRWTLHLEPFFGGKQAQQITTSAINEYIADRFKEDAATATINRELSILKRCFKLGLKADPPKVARCPVIQLMRENNTRTGFLSDTEALTVKDACAKQEPWVRALFECGYTYGWRISELLNMRVQQVDLVTRQIRLEPGTTKNREGRQVKMSTDVFQLLSGMVDRKKASDYVFTRPDGRRVRDIRTEWNHVTKAAGVPGLRFHDLRRTGARNMRRAGVSQTVAMSVGGWKTDSMFRRYAIVNDVDIADAVSKLEANRSGHEETARQKMDTEKNAASANLDTNLDKCTISGHPTSAAKSRPVN